MRFNVFLKICFKVIFATLAFTQLYAQIPEIEFVDKTREKLSKKQLIKLLEDPRISGDQITSLLVDGKFFGIYRLNLDIYDGMYVTRKTWLYLETLFSEENFPKYVNRFSAENLDKIIILLRGLMVNDRGKNKLNDKIELIELRKLQLAEHNQKKVIDSLMGDLHEAFRRVDTDDGLSADRFITDRSELERKINVLKQRNSKQAREETIKLLQEFQKRHFIYFKKDFYVYSLVHEFLKSLEVEETDLLIKLLSSMFNESPDYAPSLFRHLQSQYEADKNLIIKIEKVEDPNQAKYKLVVGEKNEDILIKDIELIFECSDEDLLGKCFYRFMRKRTIDDLNKELSISKYFPDIGKPESDLINVVLEMLEACNYRVQSLPDDSLKSIPSSHGKK